jgi:hypothetical protein
MLCLAQPGGIRAGLGFQSVVCQVAHFKKRLVYSGACQRVHVELVFVSFAKLVLEIGRCDRMAGEEVVVPGNYRLAGLVSAVLRSSDACALGNPQPDSIAWGLCGLALQVRQAGLPQRRRWFQNDDVSPVRGSCGYTYSLIFTHRAVFR